MLAILLATWEQALEAFQVQTRSRRYARSCKSRLYSPRVAPDAASICVDQLRSFTRRPRRDRAAALFHRRMGVRRERRVGCTQGRRWRRRPPGGGAHLPGGAWRVVATVAERGLVVRARAPRHPPGDLRR